MAIKETSKKINFIAYKAQKGRLKDTGRPPSLTLFVEKGMIQFPRYAIEQCHMQGRFVRFFYDPVQKIIGWKVEERVEQHDMKLWKICRIHKNGIWQVSVRKMLDLFQLGRKGLAPIYRDMEVRKYREQGVMAKPNDTYFYVELKEEYAERKSTVDALPTN